MLNVKKLNLKGKRRNKHKTELQTSAFNNTAQTPQFESPNSLPCIVNGSFAIAVRGSWIGPINR